MRKVVGWLLLLLGAFLLVAAVVALVWAPGAAERTPLNVNTYTYLTGQADKLNPAASAAAVSRAFCAAVTRRRIQLSLRLAAGLRRTTRPVGMFQMLPR